MVTHIAEIIIKAQKQKVFDTLTKPELIKLWQYNKELTTDWKAGSKIKFITDIEGKILEQWGTVLELRPNQLIKYNLFTPGRGLEDEIKNYTVTSYVLTSDNGQTKVEIIQEDNRPSGFTPLSLKPILVTLKKIVETNAT
ncbi:MAG TPA: SRPBCC family protein [Hanamia sp.]|nr:SRPBCC family protein [Hanamia sp.]